MDDLTDNERAFIETGRKLAVLRATHKHLSKRYDLLLRIMERILTENRSNNREIERLHRIRQDYIAGSDITQADAPAMEEDK